MAQSPKMFGGIVPSTLKPLYVPLPNSRGDPELLRISKGPAIILTFPDVFQKVLVTCAPETTEGNWYSQSVRFQGFSLTPMNLQGVVVVVAVVPQQVTLKF